MKRLLAIDTAGASASLALLQDGSVVAEMLLESPERLSQLLFGQILGLLERRGWNISDIDCFAAAAGPGSFTGIRIGLAAVKGLAEALARPAFGVSNLQALARCGTGKLRAAVIDARRGEIFGAVYEAASHAVCSEVVMPWRDWLATLPEAEELSLVSPDLSLLTLEATRWDAGRGAIAHSFLASAVGQIAWERLLSGDPGEPAAIDANYVRRPDAEIKQT